MYQNSFRCTSCKKHWVAYDAGPYRSDCPYCPTMHVVPYLSWEVGEADPVRNSLDEFITAVDSAKERGEQIPEWLEERQLDAVLAMATFDILCTDMVVLEPH